MTTSQGGFRLFADPIGKARRESVDRDALLPGVAASNLRLEPEELSGRRPKINSACFSNSIQLRPPTSPAGEDSHILETEP